MWKRIGVYHGQNGKQKAKEHKAKPKKIRQKIQQGRFSKGVLNG